MNIVSYDVIGRIAIDLPIEDLNALQRSCRQWWLGLKSPKLNHMWHYKISVYRAKHKLPLTKIVHSSYDCYDYGLVDALFSDHYIKPKFDYENYARTIDHRD